MDRKFSKEFVELLQHINLANYKFIRSVDPKSTLRDMAREALLRQHEQTVVNMAKIRFSEEFISDLVFINDNFDSFVDSVYSGAFPGLDNLYSMDKELKLVPKLAESNIKLASIAIISKKGFLGLEKVKDIAEKVKLVLKESSNARTN